MNLQGVYINKKELLKYVSPEEIFSYYLGQTVDFTSRYLSPFRKDNNPDCRFVVKQGYLKFVDNAPVNNRIYYNCFDFVEAITNTTNVAQKIYSDMKLGNKPVIKYKQHVKEEKVVIRYIFKDYQDCILTTKFNIPGIYLYSVNYFNVEHYWCTTKTDRTLIQNRFGKKPCIAYHFVNSDNTKLYFYEDKEIRFYANTNDDDIYLYDVVDYTQDVLFITKSGKDAIVLNYHLGLNVVGCQQEYFTLTDKWKELILKFNKIYIIFDNDSTGISQATVAVDRIQEYTSVEALFYTKDNDAAEAYLNNRLDEIIQNI